MDNTPAVYHECSLCKKVLSGFDGTMYYTKCKYWLVQKEWVVDEEGYTDYSDFHAICEPCYTPKLNELAKNVQHKSMHSYYCYQ